MNISTADKTNDSGFLWHEPTEASFAGCLHAPAAALIFAIVTAALILMPGCSSLLKSKKSDNSGPAASVESGNTAVPAQQGSIQGKGTDELREPAVGPDNEGQADVGAQDAPEDPTRNRGSDPVNASSSAAEADSAAVSGKKAGDNGTGKPPSDELFVKPDHNKYRNLIRNRAIDVLNREAPCEFAQLCTNSITGQWSLTMYRKKGKNFVFTVHAWDPIDEKWKEAFVSIPLPLSRWESHLKYAGAGKDCTVLKGTPR